MSATIPDAILETLATLHATPSVPPAANDVQVWDAQVPGIPANRYYQVVAGNELKTPGSVDGVARDISGSFTVVSVAMNPDSDAPVTFLARNLARKARDHLVGRVLTVDNLVVGAIQHTNTEGPFKDDDIADRTVMFVVDEYSVLATA